MDTTRTAALFELYVDAWEARNPDAIVALHTDDTVFHLHAGEAPAHGRDAVRDAFAALFAQFPDLSFEQVSLRVAEDFWVVEWRVSGTAGGDGPRLETDLLDVVTVEGGLVASKHSYIDSVTAQAQLGAEQPAQAVAT